MDQKEIIHLCITYTIELITSLIINDRVYAMKVVYLNLCFPVENANEYSWLLFLIDYGG